MLGSLLAVLCVLFDSLCRAIGADAPLTVSCGICKTEIANHLQKGRHDKKYKGNCRQSLLTSEDATAQSDSQYTRSASGSQQPAQSSGTPFSWEHSAAEACQPAASGSLDDGEDSSTVCSSDTTGNATPLETLQPSLDASFELANFSRRAGLPLSMVQEMLDPLHNPRFDPAEVQHLGFTHCEPDITQMGSLCMIGVWGNYCTQGPAACLSGKHTLQQSLRPSTLPNYASRCR